MFDVRCGLCMWGMREKRIKRCMIRTESITEANFPLNNSDAESHNRFLETLNDMKLWIHVLWSEEYTNVDAVTERERRERMHVLVVPLMYFEFASMVSCNSYLWSVVIGTIYVQYWISNRSYVWRSLWSLDASVFLTAVSHLRTVQARRRPSGRRRARAAAGSPVPGRWPLTLTSSGDQALTA